MNEDRKALRIGKNESTLSSQEFYMIFGGVLLYGFLLNAIFATFLTPVFANMNPAILLVGYFVLALAGVFMSKSGGSLLSFIGYNFVVIPSGAILSVCLLAYTQQSILTALFIVAFDAGVMFLVSMMWPDKMLSMGRSLFIALFVGIIAEVICLLLGVSTGIFDFIFVIIFSGYLGYDFSVVAQYDKTVDNAIDSALDVYLDIINLLLRILSIMNGSGKRRR